MDAGVRTARRYLWLLAGCLAGTVLLMAVAAGPRIVSGDTEFRMDAPGYAQAIHTWSALRSAADNACLIARREHAGGDPDTRWAGAYHQGRLRYNDLMARLLQRPPGYPTVVPDYDESNGESPNFCVVSSRLMALQAAH